MKRISLLLLTLAFISSGVYAQKYKGKRGGKSDSHGFYSISLGPSIPMGDYGSTDIFSDKTGAAKMGLHINLANVGYTFTENIGVAGLIALGANKFDAELLGSTDKDSYWSYGAIMVGPLLTVAAGDQLSIDFRPVAGMVYVAAPEVNESGSSAVLIKSDQTTGFGFNIGASARYHVNDRLDLGLHADYFTVKPKFTDTYEGWEGSVSVLGVTAGVAFRF